MKKFRSISLALFLASVILFGVNLLLQMLAIDQTGPVFSMEDESLTISVHDDEEILLEGVTAFDSKDGDVTDSILIESISPFTAAGHRIVRYAAFDADDHVTHARRNLYYSDYEPPRFAFTSPLSYPLNTQNLLEGVQVIDSIDGDITDQIQVVSPADVNPEMAGKYPAELHAADSAGGVSSLPVTIEIYDPVIKSGAPKIVLSEYLVYLEKGSPFNEKDYIKSVTINGEESDRNLIQIQSSVDTDEPGCYEVAYSVEDSEGGTGTGESWLYVVVTDSSESEADGLSAASADLSGIPTEGGEN